MIELKIEKTWSTAINLINEWDTVQMLLCEDHYLDENVASNICLLSVVTKHTNNHSEELNSIIIFTIQHNGGRILL